MFLKIFLDTEVKKYSFYIHFRGQRHPFIALHYSRGVFPHPWLVASEENSCYIALSWYQRCWFAER